jgi:2,4-dienoyl-CoA reductase-like NADH-dependent reductase (Old Yellow Enzyme family)
MMLAKPVSVGNLQVPNRIVLPPMVCWAAHEDGTVSDYNLNHYNAFRDIGLTVVEATAVSPEGRLAQKQIGAFDDKHLSGLRSLAEVIREKGSVAAIQLHHAGGSTNTTNTFGLPLIGPSPVSPGNELPEEMTHRDIERVMEAFVYAAQLVAEAGFQAIELHGAHGYLISQFLSPAFNLRKDEYGGTLQNRARFALELFRRLKFAVGDRLLVYLRLGLAEELENGLTVDEGQQVARWLVEAGAELLHISSGMGKAPAHVRPEGSPFSELMHLGALAKQAVDIPIIGVGGIKRPEQAELALGEGIADLIAVGRGLLADPLWARKALRQSGDIKYCVGCPRCVRLKSPSACPARS